MPFSCATFGANGMLMGYGKTDSPASGIGYCLECGDIIEYGHGRTDRKFCSSTCKNRWHNKRRTQPWQRYQQKVLKALETNHGILSRLLRIGVTSIDRVSLGQMGYDFNYVTSYHKVGHRNLFCCYDITYEATPSRIMHLMSRWKGSEEADGEGAASDKTSIKGARRLSAASEDP